MNNLIHTNNEITMTSHDIADLADKKHSNVLRDIRHMINEIQNSNLNPKEYQEVKAENGMTSYIVLGKELTYTLIAGYNVKLRHHIIKRWQELESKANNPTATLAGLLEQNVKMIEGLHGHVIHLEHKIEQDKPMTDFGKAISESATAVKIGDWIKAIADDGFKVGRTTAFRWLRHHGFLMNDNQPYQQYINQGLFEVKEGLIVTSRGQKATFTTLLTGKGQMYFGKKFKDYFTDNGAV